MDCFQITVYDITTVAYDYAHQWEPASMKRRRVGIMLELFWPYRRHLDVFAGTQRFADEVGNWDCEIDEFHPTSGGASPLKRYNGVIARATPEMDRAARKAGVPLVNVWYNSPLADKLPGVFPDFAEVGRQAASHLLERGFRQFACLSSPGELSHEDMKAALHERIGELGLKCSCATASRFFYRTRKSWQQFQDKLDAWIDTWSPPVAVFVAFNDVTIRYVVNSCLRRGLRVPEDVAFIGGTNEPGVSLMPPPSLSSVEVNYELIGYQAAQILHGQMRRRPKKAARELLPPSGVIARESTDYFAVDDEVVAGAMRFIEQHTAEPINVDDVAAAIDVSRRTLERRFREKTQRSVAGEIRRLRLQRAKRLLAETDMLVKQISHETGFGDPIRMHEVFVREEGITPSEFRERCQGGAK